MTAAESKQRFLMLKMGREWAALAIRHKCQPTTTGNLDHDRACAEQFLRWTGNQPEWYTEDRFGPIYTEGHPSRKWQSK